MNERIQQLSDQADAFARETVAYYRNEHDEYSHKLYKVSREKFAELIVRECANWMEDEKDENGDRIGDSFYWSDRMKKNFGVEE